MPFRVRKGGGDAPVIEELNVNENGTYTAPSGVTGYNPVIVEVPTPTPSVVTKHIRGNGIFSAADDNVDGYSSVIVDGASNNAYFEIYTLTDPSKLTLTMNSSSISGKALIQWGDGTESYSWSLRTHTYPNVGTYAIAIYPIDDSAKKPNPAYFAFGSGSGDYIADFVRVADYQSSLNGDGGYFLSYVDKIKRVMLPLGVTKMVDGDFTAMSILEAVYMQDETPPTMSYSWAIPFGNCPNLEAIYVPASAVNAYKSAAGWSTYASIIQPMPL